MSDLLSTDPAGMGKQATPAHEHVWHMLPGVVAVALPVGELIDVNPAFSKALGWSAVQARESGLLSLIHPEQRADFSAWLMTLARGEPLGNCEVRCRSLTGEYRWLSWAASWDGSFIYLCGQDVSARHAVQNAERALRQSHRMEALGQFAGRVSHDLNNLLTSILFGLDLLNRRLSAGRTQDLEPLIEVAVSSAKRAAGLTERLLAFSRKQVLDLQTLDINQRLVALQDTLRDCLGEHIDVDLRLQSGLWLVETDATQLDNMLLNLASNAREAMPGGGRVAVETANTPIEPDSVQALAGLEPGEYAAIHFSDTGVGMPPNVLERAFDPFFTTKSAAQRSGMGLSLVYSFARQARGYVQLHSEEGVGTTVSLYLPRFFA